MDRVQITTTWRDRLAEEIERDGRSKRALSLAIKNNPGYVHSLLVEGKSPSIDNAIKLCDELGISLLYLLYGFDISPETEEVLRLLQSRPGTRAGILQILKSEAGSES